MYDKQKTEPVRTFELTLERARTALQLAVDSDPREVYFRAWINYYRIPESSARRSDSDIAYERGCASGLTQDCVYTAIMTGRNHRE